MSAALLAGCSKSAATETVSTGTHTVIDHGGNTVEVPDNITRVVIDQIPILSTYMSYFGGSAPYIVGYCGSFKDTITKTVLKDIAPELMESADTVYAQSDLNIEEIMKLEPDVILYNAGNASHAEILKASEIPCIGFATIGADTDADPQDKLPEITYWLMGSFTSSTYKKLLIGSPLILIGILIIFLLRWRLNILSLSEDEANASGIDIKKTRMLFIFASTIITASAVSMCGQVGWIGLLIPHCARMLVGSNNRYVVPLSISLGACFMIMIDTMSRTVSVIELPLSVLGPNGIGKTTLLKCMIGLLPWRSGSSFLNGRNIADLSSKKVWSTISYIPQTHGFSFSYTGLEMVMMGRSSHLGLFSQPGENEIAMAEAMMEKVGITRLADKDCNRMSGGELQMVLIARALINEPKLVILDEPETGLDFHNQILVLNMIEKLAHEDGISAIMNTHYPTNALRIADEALMMNRRGDRFYGNASEILNEKNISASFDVSVIVDEVSYGEKHIRSIIPVELI